MASRIQEIRQQVEQETMERWYADGTAVSLRRLWDRLAAAEAGLERTEIYLVTGVSGDYEDRREWVVCAYVDAALAAEHVRRAQRFAWRLVQIQQLYFQLRDTYPWKPTRFLDDMGRPKANPYDSSMVFDSSGVHYSVAAMPCYSELAPRGVMSKKEAVKD